MKIVTVVRTFNEEKNIGRFCEAYDWADLVLVADGGSTDKTLNIAGEYENVKIRAFKETIEFESGHTLNPPGKHVNFLVDWAIEEEMDWLVFDDADSVPNFMLRHTARVIMETTSAPAIFLHRVFFWGFDQIFPAMHGGVPDAREGYWTSLWAWNLHRVVIRAQEKDPQHLGFDLSHVAPVSLHLDFPLCLLHYAWQTDEEVDEALKRYRESGIQATAEHPIKFAGPLADPEWYMRTDDPS